MRKSSIAHLRREYQNLGLTENKAPQNPLSLFNRWFKEALKAHALDANALALATVSPDGRPSVRMVLLKGFDAEGFVFFTNYRSRKGREIARRPVASLLFFWPQLGRQVRIDGKVRKVSAKESDEYFNSRPRGSQLGAWVSDQSRKVENRDVLEQRMKDLEEKYRGKVIPRPSHWGGYRVFPSTIEFWKGRPNRLHDRLCYRRKGTSWTRERLAP
jgi:pyridoxamine 5'-phosphate oxidase